MAHSDATQNARQFARKFGGIVRELRLSRGQTQEVLAERSGLSVDGIRRIERAGFSPSLNTVFRLCAGLGVEPSTLFQSLQSGKRDDVRELADFLAKRSAKDVALASRLLRTLFDGSDAT